MTNPEHLAALSDAATASPWHLQTGAIGVNPWISAGNWTRKDGSYVRGGCILNMVAHDEREQDAAFIVALVNAYRANQIAVIGPDAVERVARVIAPHMEGSREYDQMPANRRELRIWRAGGMCSTNDATQEDARDAATAVLDALTGSV